MDSALTATLIGVGGTVIVGIAGFGASVWNARETTKMTLQGQVADRYLRAIGQLGSDKLDVRLGSIYALERIAHDSPQDQPPVMEVLAAFIRDHSRWLQDNPPDPGEVREFPDPEIQTAITVIAGRLVRAAGNPDDAAAE
jgi:hypothetical protein